MINLLVTGGCGFIGSNFINYVYDKNLYNIINLDCMYYCASENNIDENIRKSKNYKFVKGNLCNQDLVKEIIHNNQITHVVHFAAQSHVQNSFEDSLQFTHDNILGTHTLLEVCRKYSKIELFIHVSTDEVYGESMLEEDEQHKTEHSVLCPSNPYAATKAGAELIAQSYYHSYKMPIIISRGNNVYGPNQYPEKLVPRFIKLLKEDKKVTIQGDGSCVRAFLHARDTAKAFECILEHGIIGEIYNIGCDEGMEYSVLEVAKILIKMIKNTEDCEKWIEYIPDRPFNDKRYYISNQKLRNLGWDIDINFMDGLEDLVGEKYKIKKIYLDTFLSNKKEAINYFGDWTLNLDELNDKFLNAEPYEHIIIENFLNKEYAEDIYNNFPNDIENWYKYINPIEVKYAYDDINKLPKCLKDIFYLLSTEQMIKIISKITNISNLEYDQYLHGAGLHSLPRNGRLHMHLDYEKHPYTGKQRRLNIILYMNKEWKEEWNGQTELWNKDMSECITKCPIKYNSALLFKTDEISWHGIPNKIMCPENIFRNSIAYYYVSNLISKDDDKKIGNDGTGYRKKATYVKRPEDEYNEKIDKLYKIRPFRRLEKEDLDNIYPEWKIDS